MTTVQLACASAIVLMVTGACATGATKVRMAASDADLGEFQQRVESYMQLHHTVEQQGPVLDTIADVATRTASRQALAAGIRAARSRAQQGDIFTPAVAAKLRRRMNTQLRGVASSESRASIRDDAPAKFALTVNGNYPALAPLPTMPPNVLAVLPSLPEDLEFRIVDRHLILRDVHANIIVDYLFDVMCATC